MKNFKKIRLLALSVVLMVSPAAVAAGEKYSPAINYQLRCAGCHGQDGMGVPSGGIPPFPGFIDGFFANELGRLYLMHVPGIGTASLSDTEIAGVMNYVAERWSKPGRTLRSFTPEEVTALRGKPVRDVVALRRDVIAELQAEGKPVPDYPWP